MIQHYRDHAASDRGDGFVHDGIRCGGAVLPEYNGDCELNAVVPGQDAELAPPGRKGARQWQRSKLSYSMYVHDVS